jgi:predicted N-acetyltransferase YhbS
MRIRSLGTNELDLFIDAAGFPDHRKEVEQDLDRMFAAGSMRPEWCFFAEEGGRPVGRVAFWTLPGMEEHFALVLLDVDWESDCAAVGTRLLGHTMDAARTLGAEELMARYAYVSRPPPGAPPR